MSMLRDLSETSEMLPHGELISAYAKFCHARVIVEIGVQYGNTTSYLCEAAKRTDCKVYGYDFFPDVLDNTLIDKYIKCNDKDSFLIARKLIKEEGLLCGGAMALTFSALFQPV